MIVRMWEARAYRDGFAELLDWVCEDAVPGLESAPGHLDTEVFSAADRRVVVISRWRGEPAVMPEPPGHLVPRDPHAWDFTPVDR
ncbi:hypothetical protein [Actinocatenispora rupis]|uniref:hypothetical protein n=1 Tax=Actinocatenispora rupis TaxID=519421 RepID=UPI0019420824|nr:hypothetical protein [Actinocatenispora rupis]